MSNSYNSMQEIDERASLTNNNKFELLLFRLDSSNELYGINVFKVREIMVMPSITKIARGPEMLLGMAEIRGQVLPVIDLPKMINGGVSEKKPNILLITEYSRSTQAFAVEAVEEIVRLEWGQVVSAEQNTDGGFVTSIARFENEKGLNLVQVLDVEEILREVLPGRQNEDSASKMQERSVFIKPGAKVLAADDSGFARALIEGSLKSLGLPYIIENNGLDAWNTISSMAEAAEKNGKSITDEIALVLTDLEMPEMDGFTLTRKIKAHKDMKQIPVIIHSSLSGNASEDHVQKVGADAYVAKFVANELADVIQNVMSNSPINK
ncbi:chemotaxis protein [Thorsellia kenyensis]|uniref:Chemotaxis protein n=1 Tax=Thorsellia kenyensis TaxID=1549888 RepID=A0ABV6CEF7_9GAMM